MESKKASTLLVVLSLLLIMVFIVTAAIGSNSIINSRISARQTPTPEPTTTPTFTPSPVPVEIIPSTTISDPDEFFDEYEWSKPRKITKSENYSIQVTDMEAGFSNEIFYLSGNTWELLLPEDASDSASLASISQINRYYSEDLKTAGWKESFITKNNQTLKADFAGNENVNTNVIMSFDGENLREIVTETATDSAKLNVFVSNIYTLEEILTSFK